VRCPLDPDVTDVFQPGDLHTMFERIVDGVDGRERWNATVHSRPDHPPSQHDVVVESSGRSTEEEYMLGPWVITIDNFVSPTECERLIHLGSAAGYERSTDVGGMNFDGTTKAVQSTSRTSSNAWCNEKCLTDPTTKGVLDNIAELTGIPDENSEHLQLLRYIEGQFYKQHHDYIGTDRTRPIGVRILTAYLYLNNVEAGGGTRFPKLTSSKHPKGLTVMPQQGRLLLWPSVRNDAPDRSDVRTDHEALTVEKGEKYGANGWIHLRDFKGPYDRGCT